MLVIRITNEGYRLIDRPTRDEILEELSERWDHIFEEARWGSITQAMEMYAELFEWIDQFGKKVYQCRYRADVVLPPRDIELDELKYLLGSDRR
ncbi:MAG: hypothetical protein ACFFD8_01830 [Candidatus Thorarchaeota archaeon]